MRFLKSNLLINLLLLTIIFILAESCKDPKSDLETYLIDELSINPSDNEVFIIINFDTCNYCLLKVKEVIESTLESEIDQNLILVISSFTKKEVVQFFGGGNHQ